MKEILESMHKTQGELMKQLVESDMKNIELERDNKEWEIAAEQLKDDIAKKTEELKNTNKRIDNMKTVHKELEKMFDNAVNNLSDLIGELDNERFKSMINMVHYKKRLAAFNGFKDKLSDNLPF